MVTRAEIEQTVVGSMLCDPGQIPKVLAIVSSADFSPDMGFRSTFDAIVELHKAGEVITPETVAAKSEYPLKNIKALTDIVATGTGAELYARLLKGDGTRSRISRLLEAQDLMEVLPELRAEVEALSQGCVLTDLINTNEMSRMFLAHREQVDNDIVPMVPTGFSRLDSVLGGGLIKGGLIIVGASPGSGKTSLAINIADNVQGNVLFVSCEMTPLQIMTRRVAAKSGISSKILTSRKIDDYSKIIQTIYDMNQSGLSVSRNPSPTVSEIATMAGAIDDLKLIVVDYLGLLKADKQSSKYEEISQLSRSLKTLAVRLDVPILCLSQLNRDASKEKKKPTLASLRDSGQIEADADVVILLSQDSDGRIVLADIAKNRHGECDKIYFNFETSTCRFSEIVDQEDRFIAKEG